MSRLSISAAADETRAFMRREGSLVFPVAFATFGMALILVSLMMPQSQPGEVQPGWWMILLLPLILLGIVGQLAISYLVLRPGVTVADALRRGVARLPIVLGIIVAFALAAALFIVAASVILGVIAIAVGMNEMSAARLAVMAMLVFLIWLGVRLLLLWPTVAGGGEGVKGSIQRTFALSRGRAWKFFALLILFGLVYGVLTIAVQFGLGSILLLFGRMVGSEAAGAVLTVVLVGLLAAAIQAFWTVLLAHLYRQLAPDRI